MRKLAAIAVGLQASAAGLWWVFLWLQPEARPWFRPAAAPDATLLAFALPDLLLFTLAGLATALGTWRHNRWAWPALLLHTGAALYAALYCLQLTMLTGEAVAGALLMAPSLILLPAALWITRP